MKHYFKILTIAVFLAIAPLLTFAQSPPHPNGGNNPVPGTNAPVGASVGDGVFILLTFAIAYGSRKLYAMRKAPETEKV
jgi:hypothetical protein